MLNPPAETCDDGNHTGGDGCSPDCKTETDWICPTPGSPCVYTVACGDGMIAGAETCDDSNTKAGDGCDASCQLEPGWTCPQTGARCVPRCGDGTQLGFEQCDDGNASPGDGCSDACRVEPGFACPTPGQACHRTTCGDGVKEGSEACDDGNAYGGDGCGADCRAEPVCAGTNGCTSPCGDGLKLPSEACDDGNAVSGDGCSATCTLEPSWDCRDASDADGGNLVVPVVYRDFLSRDAPNGHPELRRGRLRHDRDRHGPGDARGGPQAGDGRRAAAERVVDHGGRLRRVVPRLAAEQGRARHDDADAASERHVRLRSFGEVERHRAGRVDHAAVLPGRRSRMGRAAGRPGDQPPRRLRQRSGEAQLQLHQRGALLVRVRRRRDAGVHRRRRRLGLRQRPAGGRSGRHSRRIVGQRHPRRRGRDAVRAHRRPHLRDRRVPGGAPPVRLVVQAHARLLRAQDDRLHAPLRGRDRRTAGRSATTASTTAATAAASLDAAASDPSAATG